MKRILMIGALWLGPLLCSPDAASTDEADDAQRPTSLVAALAQREHVGEHLQVHNRHQQRSSQRRLLSHSLADVSQITAMNTSSHLRLHSIMDARTPVSLSKSHFTATTTGSAIFEDDWDGTR
jgi:hypothetical protein